MVNNQRNQRRINWIPDQVRNDTGGTNDTRDTNDTRGGFANRGEDDNVGFFHICPSTSLAALVLWIICRPS